MSGPVKYPKFCQSCGKEYLILDPEDELLKCSICNWVHYDNPVPAAVVLASRTGDQERKIVMVRRRSAPFPGEWCLPCGYINRYEIPKTAAVREMQEETGLSVRLEKILCVCSPLPGEVNVITVSYLGRITGGVLNPGDDAEEAGEFGKEECPVACFRSHRMLIEKWWSGRLGDLTGVDLD